MPYHAPTPIAPASSAIVGIAKSFYNLFDDVLLGGRPGDRQQCR